MTTMESLDSMMNEQDLLSIGELLEHPEQYPDVDERDIRDLAIGYHLAEADKIAAKIMESITFTGDVNAAIQAHEDFPRYAFHIDEANRNAAEADAPTVMEAFSESMEPSLDRVLFAASKVLSGQLLTRDEMIKDKAD